MRPTWTALIAFALTACTGGGGGPFTVTVIIPDSYFGPHADTDYSLAIVDSEGTVVDEATDTLPASAGASVDTDFTVDEGSGYEIHLWVDSNIGGGTAGTCDGDPDFYDHQWSYSLGTVDADRDFTLPAHNTTFTDVCDTF